MFDAPFFLFPVQRFLALVTLDRFLDLRQNLFRQLSRRLSETGNVNQVTDMIDVLEILNQFSGVQAATRQHDISDTGPQYYFSFFVTIFLRVCGASFREIL
jgi:hypothetical protein